MPSLDNSAKITITSEADTKAVQQATRDVKDLGDANKDAAPKAEEHDRKATSLAGTISKLGLAFAATQIIHTVANFGSQLLSSAGELEQTNMSFQSLIGNTEQANHLFGQLTQYANTTPFQVKDVTGAAKQLLAFGETADDTTRIVKQLGDVASAGGGDLQAMSLVSGQVFAQGKMRAQDMYQVINDGGAGLIHIMAQNAGGMQNLTAMFDKGGIPAKAYFDAINQAAGQGGFAFQGAQKQAETFNGQMSTLKDTVTQFGLKLLGVHVDPELGLVVEKGGLFDKAKKVIGEIINLLTELSKHKVAIEAIAGAIGGVLLGSIVALGFVFIATFGWIPLLIIGIAILVGALVAVFVANWGKIKEFAIKVWHAIRDFAEEAIKKIREIVKDIGDFFKKVWDEIKEKASKVFHAIGEALHDVYKTAIKPVIDFMVSAFKVWWAVVSYIFDVFRGVALVVWWFIYNNVVKPVMDAITKAIKWLGDVVSGVWHWIKDKASEAWNWLWDKVIEPVIHKVSDAANWVGGVVTGVWHWIKDTAGDVWDKIWGFIKGVWDKISDAGHTAGTAISNVFSGIADGVKTAFVKTINWIIDKLNGLIHTLNNTVGKLPGVPKIGDIPKFRTGTNFAPGGTALVGEDGPELVDLPRGSKVYNSRQTAQMGGGGHTFIIQNLSLPGVTDRQSFIESMDADVLLTGRGLTPNMGRR